MNVSEEWSNWYVLTTHNPHHLENLIEEENKKCVCYECYCPYTALPKESSDYKEYQYSLRAALRKYVFVRLSKTIKEGDFAVTVSKWNSTSTDTIFFLRNSFNVKATVSSKELDIMKAGCNELLFKPHATPSVHNLKVGQEIELSNTPFADSDRKCDSPQP